MSLLYYFVVLCVRLDSYCISFETVFTVARTSDMCIKLLLTYPSVFIFPSLACPAVRGYLPSVNFFILFYMYFSD